MKIRWTLRDMFLLAFIVALIVPYFINWIPNELNPLTGFSISEAELESWLQEVDPTVSVTRFGHPEIIDKIFQSDVQYTVQMKHATHEELMDHLYEQVGAKINKSNWTSCNSYGTGEACACSFAFSSGYSRHRIYIWEAPLTRFQRELEDPPGKTMMKIRILHFWFNYR